MIISEEKPLEEILEIVAQYKNIGIVGCSGCYGVGIIKNVEVLAQKLEANGKNVVAKGATGRQCSWFWEPTDGNILLKKTKGVDVEDLEKVEIFLSLACGVGAQTLSKAVGSIPVAPAADTKFMGRREEAEFYEQCMACGNCIIHTTGGICPITKCPKSHMNGPCGGVYDGKCEVNRKNDCIWVLIYRKLTSLDKQVLMKDKRTPKDFSIRTHPRKIVTS
jgi:hypothetical protein